MLQEYKRKRDFKITPEPAGGDKSELTKREKGRSLSFVIQKHRASHLHYDFRLEVDGVMVSWAVPKGPSLDPAVKRLAMMTEDHPMEYSSFEGIIPEKQYGAGEVIIWDHGTYSPDEGQVYSWNKKAEANTRMRDGLVKGKLSFYLKGAKLEGSWTLVRLHGKVKEWLLIKHRDQFVDTENDVTLQDASVVSNQTIEDLQQKGAERIWTSGGSRVAAPKTTGKSSKHKTTLIKSAKSSLVLKAENALEKAESSSTLSAKSKKPVARKKNQVSDGAEVDLDELLTSGKTAPFPKQLSPMLATLADAPFERKGWFFEPKLDGVRAISFIKNGECHMTSRSGNDLTTKYSAIAENLKDYDGTLVFDGEVVALDESGRPSFQHLQQSGIGLRSFNGKKKKGDFEPVLIYYVFDILYAHGKSLVGLPVIERKRILERVLRTDTTVRLVQSLGPDGFAVFKACEENNLEGMVGKREDSTYEVGARSQSWLKVKTSMSGEFLVCGYTEGTGSRRHTFGSLLLGEFDAKGTLQFVGGVGTGFDGKKLDALLSKMQPLITKKSPFAAKVKGKLNPTWLEPTLVAEVKYLERTQENILRAPVYLHLRDDIKPGQVKSAKTLHVKSPPSNDSATDFAAASAADSRTNSAEHSAHDSVKDVANQNSVKNKAGKHVRLHTVRDLSDEGNDTVAGASNRSASKTAAIDAEAEGSSSGSKKPTKKSKIVIPKNFSKATLFTLEQLDNEKEKLTLEAAQAIIPLTSLNKILWPAQGDQPPITKRDYLRYLAKVADYVIPHLTDRLITLVRFPNGIDGMRFYQKHWEQGLPKFVKTVRVFTEGENKDQDFLVCNNLPTLLWLGQIADLELHTSHTRMNLEPDASRLSIDTTGSVSALDASVANYPDYIVLDLDPYLYSGKEKEGAEPELHERGFENTREVAFILKNQLDALEIKAFVKTSGKTGLHIYIPIKRDIDYDTVRTIAELLCRQVLKEHPDKVTMEWAVKKRGGKIFMDHNMNARSKSLASIYSTRVSPEACVSTPISWDELKDVYPTDFNTHTVPDRLLKVGDLWQDILSHKNDLHSLLKKTHMLDDSEDTGGEAPKRARTMRLKHK